MQVARGRQNLTNKITLLHELLSCALHLLGPGKSMVDAIQLLIR